MCINNIIEEIGELARRSNMTFEEMFDTLMSLFYYIKETAEKYKAGK